MAKHARKKQKTANTTETVQPLGSVAALTDETSKDDEERRLESLLFGTPYNPPDKSGDKILVVSDNEREAEDAGDNELQHMLDTDLFFIDDTGPRAELLDIAMDVDFAAGESSENGSDADEVRQGSSYDEEEEEEEDSADEDDVVVATETPSFLLRSSKKKGPAWIDPDDPDLQVSLANDKRLRKLRDAAVEDMLRGKEYERRLRRQFQKINPTPEWAAKARKKLHPEQTKRRRSSSASASDLEGSDEDILPELLSDARGILQRGRRPKALPHGTLSIERLRDANLSARSEGEVKAVQFHPSPQVPVLLTAGSDRRLRLFNVDGHTNPLLQTVHIPELPITNALFHPGGTSVLLSGPRPFYYHYDLQSGTAQRSPRGLWGTTFSNANPAAQDASMEICAFDPSGSVLAVAGRRGHVHLVDWRAGQGQVVGGVKMNAPVKSVRWTGGSGERSELVTLGEDAEVYVWDVGERRCVRRWKDDGGFGSRLVESDSSGRYLAIGSRTGLVNVYGSEGPTSLGSSKPKLLKTLGNLTTSITALRFNHDSQLLAMASNTKKDQMRLIHLPSLTAFSNWPTSSTPLGHVTSVDFSTGSEYLAIGNNRGRVLLYHLKDFALQ
ncbi:WD40 repeat-like protein [Laetiporus sulphureus 93-53]|uniref:WD40 repeat-like protein n=1 Tax=Laetiporus sulphureus 93-53 TaxID=1314785 RepID=A0A165FXZ3_9APHY|nr:WD40 repeat-like protein [Laetiporus sulphureus 93-53]KZT09564.1 WD40 repeat-like protein [Laetiporus sulphureus 93-53]